MGSLYLPGPAGGRIDMPDGVVASFAEALYPSLQHDRVFYLIWTGRDENHNPRKMTAVISRATPPAFVYETTTPVEAVRSLVDEIQDALEGAAGFDISRVTF